MFETPAQDFAVRRPTNKKLSCEQIIFFREEDTRTLSCSFSNRMGGGREKDGEWGKREEGVKEG